MNNLMFDGSQNITIGDSIFITIISMSIVFFVLSLISLTLSFFKYIPSDTVESKKNEKKIIKDKIEDKKENYFDPRDIKDDRMRAAIIVASIEASKEVENTFIKIKSVKELN